MEDGITYKKPLMANADMNFDIYMSLDQAFKTYGVASVEEMFNKVGS